MATLYVANCTNQFYTFSYRIPADEGYGKRTHEQVILPGQQMRIYADAPLKVLEAIVEQKRPYGIVHVSEVVRTKQFVGICYEFDKPVDLERFQYAVDHNHGVLVERGEELRQEAALATNLAINTAVQDAQRHDPSLPRANLKTVDVVTLEESDNPTFGSAVKISRDAAPPSIPWGERRRA